MRLELHCHSRYSKGKKIPAEGIDSPRDIIRAAKAMGLDGLALTDHSTNRGWTEGKEEAKRIGILFIPAIEISSLQGHVIGLGLNEFVKSGLPLEDTLELVRGQGAVSVAAHPFDIRNEGVGRLAVKADVIESFNSMNLDRFSNNAARALAVRSGRPAVAGSDAHTKEMLGACVNHVEAHDLDSCLKRIKSGNVTFTSAYMPLEKLLPWVRMRLTLSHSDILEYIESSYSQPKRWVSERMLCKFISSHDDRYWRWLGEIGFAGARAYGMARNLSSL